MAEQMSNFAATCQSRQKAVYSHSLSIEDHALRHDLSSTVAKLTCFDERHPNMLHLHRLAQTLPQVLFIVRSPLKLIVAKNGTKAKLHRVPMILLSVPSNAAASKGSGSTILNYARGEKNAEEHLIRHIAAPS